MRERTYTQSDKEYLEELKEEIVMTHEKCGGLGYISGTNENITCECMNIFKYIKELHYSRIPKEYWPFDVSNISISSDYKGEIKFYIANLMKAKKKGLGLIFSGPQRGIGKTTSMSIIGKAAIQLGLSPYYVIAQNIIDDKFSKDKQILERIKDCDMLLIDELDKIVIGSAGSNIPKQLENLLRAILPNKKPVIICTNFTPEEIEETFQITSLLDRYMKIIDMEGVDHSKKLKSKWDDRLVEDEEIDYHNKITIKESKIFYKNTKKEG